MRFSLRSLLAVSAIVALCLGVGRWVWEATAWLGPDEWQMFGWLAGIVVLAAAVAAVVVYANR